MSEVLACLQWNIGLTHESNEDRIRSRIQVLRELIRKYNPTFIALQEANHSDVGDAIPNETYSRSNKDGLLTAFDQNYWLDPDTECVEKRFVIMRFRSIDSAKPDVVLANLHAQSQVHGGRQAPQGTLKRLQNELFYLRKSDGYNAEEIVVGDFNLNPYEDILTSKDELCAHRSLPNVRTQVRTRTVTYRPLYNPLWHLYGRREGALGTYYYSSLDHDAPWALLDQVMTTSNLAYNGDDAIELITEINEYNLVKGAPKFIPNQDIGSDHLPIVVRFRHDVVELGD